MAPQRGTVTASPTTGCPLGRPDCPLTTELDSLRREVARLSEQSRVDALTGLYNLRHLLACLDQELVRTGRTGQATAFIMADLDHFKRVNDTWGHEAGNAVLQGTAARWRRSLRSLDILCRYGGEEFGIVLPGTGLQEAVMTAERLRHVLESAPFEHEGDRIALTASFGVEVYDGNRDLTANELIAEADGFLLEAKARGRNRVVSRELPRMDVDVEERVALQTSLREVTRKMPARRRPRRGTGSPPE